MIYRLNLELNDSFEIINNFQTNRINIKTLVLRGRNIIILQWSHYMYDFLLGTWKQFIQRKVKPGLRRSLLRRPEGGLFWPTRGHYTYWKFWKEGLCLTTAAAFSRSAVGFSWQRRKICFSQIKNIFHRYFLLCLVYFFLILGR